jgi:two-component system response regulator YesN
MLGLHISKKFLLTYLLFFIILVILFVPFYHQVMKTYKNNYLDTSLYVLEVGLNNFENDLSSIHTMAQGIYSNLNIRRVAYITHPLSIEEYYRVGIAKTEFTKFLTLGNMVMDCGLVFPNNIILTPQRIHHNGEDFYNYFFNDNTVDDYSRWKHSLIENNSISNLCPLHGITTYDNRTYKALTLVIKLPLTTTRYHGLFFATIEKKYLLSYFATKEMLDYGMMRIYDKNNTLLLEHENCEDDNLNYVEVKSEKLGLHIMVGIKNSFFTEKLNPLRDIAFGFFSLYVLLGLIMSCLFAYTTSKPLQRITDKVFTISRNYFHDDKPSKLFNEFKYIISFLNEVDYTFYNYEQVVFQQKELLRSNLFEHMIRGITYAPSKRDKANIYFPDFPDQYCIAIILPIELDSFKLSPQESRQTIFLSIIKPKLPRGALIHFTDDMVVLLLPCSNDKNENKNVEHLLLDINDELYKGAAISCNISVSDVFSKLEDIHVAFYEAYHLLRMVGKTPADKIYRKKEYPVASLPLIPGVLESNHFFDLILNAEKEQAVDMVTTTLKRIKEIGFVDENEIQQIFYSYRRLFIRLKDELQEEYGSRIVLPIYDNKSDVDSLFSRIVSCTDIACDCVGKKRKDEMEIFEQSVLSYINDNLYNTELYIKMVTNRFKISENTLQIIMYKLTNTSFFDYVEKQRMEKAQNLIRHTTDPFSKLAKKCGYSSPNSFYKAFRRNFGISPSIMRKSESI